MAKYLDYTGLGTFWGNIKNYFPGVKTKSGDTVSLNTGVAAGNIATFAIDTNNYVSLQGIATSTFAQASHAHGSITSAGAITGSGTALASGDYLVFADSSDSNKLKKSTITIGTSTTTFLREDGSWATPANTARLKVSDTSNKKVSTTESSSNYLQFTSGTNKFTVSDGTNSFEVAVTPSITNNVTGSELTANTIILGNGSSSIKTSSKTIETSLTNDESKVPTSSAVYSAISGLSGAMHFIGTTTTALTDGATTATLAGSGLNKTTGFVAGDVVIYDNKEFVWTGSAWEILGDEGSYALKTVSITGAGVLGGGGDLSANRTITHNTSGVTAQAYGPTANVSGANSIAIPKITVDECGHITAATTFTYTGSTVGSGKLQLKGSASGATATDSGFTANSTSAAAITFAIGTGDTISSITTSGGTVTFNGATIPTSLKNPNSLKVGTKPSSSGTATDVITYDGSAGKALYFSTAAASTTNVKFAIDSNGFITGTVTDSGNTNTAKLKVSDTSNKRISTEESSSNYIQFAGGTNKFTVSDAGGTNSFEVAITPSISNNVTYTGTLVADQVATWSNTTGTLKASGYTIGKSVPSDAVFTDTKNTAGSTAASASTIYYIIGAASQAANPQTI